MLPDPLDRPPGDVDRESERWWAELMDEPPSPPPPPLRLRRRRSAPPRASRSVAVFLTLLVGVLGVVAFVERGRPSFRASYDEGGHLGGTAVEGATGHYAFLRTHPGTKEPVTYPPCRAISVRVNSSGEVPGGFDLVLDAMARVSELSGLRLQYVGPSTQRPPAWRAEMEGVGLEAYPPALVSWSDEDETPDLADDVVGVGGSISVTGAAYARARYMTGSVTLDGPDLAEMLDRPGGDEDVRAVIMHELGHLVGLGHVTDPGELMSERNDGQRDFGPGDREGLARLGSGTC